MSRISADFNHKRNHANGTQITSTVGQCSVYNQREVNELDAVKSVRASIVIMWVIKYINQDNATGLRSSRRPRRRGRRLEHLGEVQIPYPELTLNISRAPARLLGGTTTGCMSYAGTCSPFFAASSFKPASTFSGRAGRCVMRTPVAL